jgi:CRISPR-associated protein Cmr6
MRPIPNAHRKVPMVFRAQVKGRCQLHLIDTERKKSGDDQDVQIWTEEWLRKAQLLPQNQPEIQTATYQTKTYQIIWRFVTNGGQDDGMIRPVIGAYGIPLYPGSSMKGAFRRACQQLEQEGKLKFGTCDQYCGDALELAPGHLRFQGAYPINDWTQSLIDMVHPQQGWQVKTFETANKQSIRGESAYAQVSLYQPNLRFGISSTQSLSDEQWQEIWSIWEQAIALGIGSRVSAGYGQISTTANPILYRVRLKGQGQAAKLIDDSAEFRPNMFRAALRGHALRIFGGLTSATIAEQLVKELFGGIQNGTEVGLLGFQFNDSKLTLSPFGQYGYEQRTYGVEGDLTWFLTHLIEDSEKQTALKKLVASLMQFSMVLGGFGKTWRRVDHRLFYDQADYEKLIGCHWQWVGDKALSQNAKVWRLNMVGTFIDKVQQQAKAWTTMCGRQVGTEWAQDWRESWHSSNVQVWGREASSDDNCEAIAWFHKPYQSAIGSSPALSIKQSSLTGKMSQVGRIWHRMYPVTEIRKNPDDPKKPIIRKTLKYLELLTIFPDDSEQTQAFLDFLHTNPYGFEKLWGGDLP